MDNIKLSIEEANENISKTQPLLHMKYRYTFPDNKDWTDLQDRINRFRNIFQYIKSHYANTSQMTGGLEEYTKGMRLTKPHIHIHFMSKSTGGAITKALAREFDMIGRCQSCKAEIIVDDNKFWRYPLKQQKNDTKKHLLVIGFSQEEVKNMLDVAYDCWIQAAQVAVGKLEKKIERTSKDRLFQYFDTLPFVYKSKKQSYILAYEYFTEHEDTVCVKTIDGYVNLYLLKYKHLTYEEFYDLTH